MFWKFLTCYDLTRCMSWNKNTTSEDGHFDAWRSKWVNQPFSQNRYRSQQPAWLLGSKYIHWVFQEHVGWAACAVSPKKGSFCLEKRQRKKYYIYITYTYVRYSYLNQDFPVYPWTSRNFVTGYIYIYFFFPQNSLPIKGAKLSVEFPKNYNSGPTVLCK